MKHLKSFKLFESIEDDVTNEIIDIFGEFPDINDVVKYCYDNFEKITGLPETYRDDVEKEFPFIIKNVIEFFNLTEAEFIGENHIQDIKTEKLKDEEYDESIKRNITVNLELRDLEAELINLKNQYKQVMFDMEQEAEREGGPIADEYSTKMEDLENQIRNVENSIKDIKFQIH